VMSIPNRRSSLDTEATYFYTRQPFMCIMGGKDSILTVFASL